ncbi:MAG: efflux RND transporter permease subunit [Gammaproteobacteria bacterium]|nr:efflux RND transporter permease subunit [Gammaproteobacteria bacterium]
MMSLWEFAVRRWQFTLVVFTLLIAVGVATFANIPRAEDPSLTFPGALIIVAYPGADPVDMERLVVDKIEDALNELDGIKKIDSEALDGLATVQIEFYYGIDPERRYDEVVREINAVRPELPANIAHLEIRKFKPSLTNIVQMALVSKDADWRTLKNTAEDLEDLIEKVPGIRKADTWAYPKPELRVAIDLERLSRAGVSLGQVEQAIRSENVSIPGGSVDVGLRRYNLRTSGSYESLEEVADTVINSRGGRLVRVRDVATVSWDAEQEQYLGRFKGQRAVFVTANMKDNENVFQVRDKIYASVTQWEKTLPAGITLELGFDQSRNVHHRLSRLGMDFAIALGLVVLTLLPLGLRAGGVVMISIPLSLAIGLSALYFTGFSLNQLSIAGFVLALGLLVDDSIVVVENIARHIREGTPRVEAAIAATKQISLAVLGCTATLLLAFMPLLFLPEGAGAFIRVLPATILYTIIASLFVALTIIPFLASRMLRGGPRETPASGPFAAAGRRMLDRSDEVAERVLAAFMRVIHGVYGPALRVALAHPRKTLAGALAVFVASLGLIPLMGFSLFPLADIPQFYVRVDAPDGSSLAETDRALKFVEDELAARPEVKYWFANVGSGNPRVYFNVYPRGNEPNVGEVFVELKEYDARRTPEFLDELRDRFETYPGARINVRQFTNGPPVAAPIAIRVTGPDLDTLRSLAAQVETIIASTEGTRSVDNPVRLQRTQLALNVDTEKAALLGVPSVEADRTVRMAVAGLSVGRYREPDGDEYDITMRLPIQGHPTLDVLDHVQVSSLSGQQVPLRQIANPAFETAPSVIRRHARQRAVSVRAWTDSGYNTDRLTREIVERVEKVEWPAGYRFEVAGDAEAAKESFGGLGTTLLIAAFGILAVLVLEFGSFRSTLIVAGVVPLGITGAVTALFLSGYDLSFTAVVGMIALVGIEIKNSILLVDFTNQLRAGGAALDEAIEKAGEVRFLPILLTSMTAIGGMLPLAVQGSGLYSPLAVVIIGGLISSTLLARLVTPVMYKLLPPSIAVTNGAA